MAKVTPLDSAAKAAIKPALDQIETFDITDRLGVGPLGARYNPDDLVGRKGLTIYAKMLNDDQLKAATQFKLAAIMARGYEFVFADGSKLSKEEQSQRKLVYEQILRRMRGSFDTVIENIATARVFGFSISEKIYTNIDVDGKQYVGLNKIVLRDPGSFQFVADDHGELIRIEQRIGKGSPLIVDTDSVVHYVHKPMWDQFYGRSELRAAHLWWYVKDQVTKMWPLYLEKYGAGFGVARRTSEQAPSTTSPEGVTLTNALKNIRQLTSIYLPQGVEFDLKFPASGDVYEKCITFCDLAMARSQLVPNLLGFSHTGQTGAFAQSQTQFEAFLWTTKSDGQALEECCNEQIFEPLGRINWGDGEYPQLQFKPTSFEHVKWMLTTWKDLLGANAVVQSEEDEAFIRKLLDMPPREPDQVLRNPIEEERIAREQQAKADQAAAADALMQQQQQQRPPPTFERALTEIRTILERLSAPVSTAVHVHADGTRHSDEKTTGDHRAAPDGDLRGVPREVFDRAVERVHFAVVEKRTDAIAASYVPVFAQLIAKVVKRALGTDENMQALTDEDPSDVVSFDVSSVDRGKLRKLSLDMLQRGLAMGYDLARNEIDRARGSAPISVEASRQRFTSLQDNASGYFDAVAFRMAGDASDQVRKVIQQRLQNGIKYGTPVKEVRANIWADLVSKGYTTQDAVQGVEPDESVIEALSKIWEDTPPSTAVAYLDTLVRTNTFEAFNEARFAEFTDPALSDFVVALRYSAVLDSSTTEICTELGTGGPDGGGVIFSANSPLWDRYRPPNHYNCRSILVAITAVDGWDGVESSSPSVEPQVGFG